jgi:transposase
MFELTDQAFTLVRPLLPADSRRGKPWRDHRQVLGGILWKLHTGRPWRDVPERFGPRPTPATTSSCPGFIESISGPHPDLESDFALFCEVVVPGLT